MSPALEVRGLRFTYPDGRLALGGIELTVEEGQRVAVLGPNGAGKTTLALHLNGILRGSGSITVDGLELNDDNLDEIRRRVGLVFQDANDQLFMPTVAEDVAFGPANLGLAGAELEERVAAALRQVNAADLARRPPHHLSGGEKRSAAIATALAMEPQMLVLDEPTSGLDPLGRRELVETLQALDMTLLIITHDLPFALELCERSVIVDGGEVVATGATPDILANDALLRRHRLEMPFGFRKDNA
ncbi:MAG TPA: ABC transporter ATP-binding protein [Acidimicrobiia bacterium]|nr:ABC transporter ATP-binding protein [Acidimicrobiia bacterium]